MMRDTCRMNGHVFRLVAVLASLSIGTSIGSQSLIADEARSEFQRRMQERRKALTTAKHVVDQLSMVRAGQFGRDTNGKPIPPAEIKLRSRQEVIVDIRGGRIRVERLVPTWVDALNDFYLRHSVDVYTGAESFSVVPRKLAGRSPFAPLTDAPELVRRTGEVLYPGIVDVGTAPTLFNHGIVLPCRGAASRDATWMTPPFKVQAVDSKAGKCEVLFDSEADHPSRQLHRFTYRNESGFYIVSWRCSNGDGELFALQCDSEEQMGFRIATKWQITRGGSLKPDWTCRLVEFEPNPKLSDDLFSDSLDAQIRVVSGGLEKMIGADGKLVSEL
jgi:hypothetical protein